VVCVSEWESKLRSIYEVPGAERWPSRSCPSPSSPGSRASGSAGRWCPRGSGTRTAAPCNEVVREWCRHPVRTRRRLPWRAAGGRSIGFHGAATACTARCWPPPQPVPSTTTSGDVRPAAACLGSGTRSGFMIFFKTYISSRC
jgi:hypothetical protein